MQCNKKSWVLVIGGAALMSLAVSMRGVHITRDRPAPMDNWTIPDLVSHLERCGLKLRLVSVAKNGDVSSSAYLTMTDKEWDDLNLLHKDSQYLGRWKGTLYCERVSGYDQSALIQQWGENGLSIGPFVLYGDRDLLDQVRTVFSQPPRIAALY